MIKFNLILILLLLLIITNFTQSAESDNDCSCPIEEIFDSNWKDGVIKSPGCEYWNNPYIRVYIILFFPF